MTTASTSPTTASPTVLERDDWEARASAHAQRADSLTEGHRERSPEGRRHAVEDFLFDYYGVKPRHIRRWHPGLGVGLQGADAHADFRWYTTSDTGVTAVSAEAFAADRGQVTGYIRDLLSATAKRRPLLGCFGMHEWAMVYQADETDRRHGLPLRLGRGGTDAVVEAHDLVCTHFDAFRFFTPEAAPLNAHALTRESQPAMDQPGCLHATMDLFKWAVKLGPTVPGETLLDCFALAADVRRVDMQASPYDVSSYGLQAIPVETADGKREYARLQREFADRAAPLRSRLIEICDEVLEVAQAPRARAGSR